ncbi:uncharacterized protein LOC105661741 isoform X3 [Megachile rotundata]|uniref:uncharacterized protein LOC105661741 isoform X3 n=1 Tax=Megachile rotundata TaxID=143995 RepID=UPI003FCF35AA
MSRERISTDEENELLDEILEEDEEKEDDDGSENCLAECAEDPGDQKKLCACIHMAEHSSRFSLRVMEAMRSLQNDENDFLPTSSVDDIVDYIQENYRDDGDLYAQVRTALKQVCSQGLVLRQAQIVSRVRHDRVSRQMQTVYLVRRPCIYRPISFAVRTVNCNASFSRTNSMKNNFFLYLKICRRRILRLEFSL